MRGVGSQGLTYGNVKVPLPGMLRKLSQCQCFLKHSGFSFIRRQKGKHFSVCGGG